MTKSNHVSRLSMLFTLLFAAGTFPLAGAANTEDDIEMVGRAGKAPVLKGPYLGQQAPGLTAELFAPGFVSVTGRYEFALSFTPTGDRVLFTVQTEDEKVMVLHAQQLDGQWTPPAPVSLAAGARKDEMEAFFSPDGHHVFFAPYDEGMDVRIWQVSVDGDQWHDPAPLQGAISEDPAFYPTMATDGSLYYSNIKQRRPYVARLQNDGSWDAKPVAVEFGMHVFIAPDPSFMLLDARAEDSFGGSDIFVAFPAQDGGWQTPLNLGPGVNSTYGETCPSLSADGRYLFFSRYNEAGDVSQIYWVDADVIGQARTGSERTD
jgi:Tol biopolymer transport system component